MIGEPSAAPGRKARKSSDEADGTSICAWRAVRCISGERMPEHDGLRGRVQLHMLGIRAGWGSRFPLAFRR